MNEIFPRGRGRRPLSGGKHPKKLRFSAPPEIKGFPPKLFPFKDDNGANSIDKLDG